MRPSQLTPHRAQCTETDRLPRWPCPPRQGPPLPGAGVGGEGVQVPGQALESLELFAVPALPPCHRQVTFGQNTVAGSWLWATLWPLLPPSLPGLSSRPRQAPDRAVSLPPLLPLPLFCAQPSPSWRPPLWPPPLWPSSPPLPLLSQSQRTAPGLVPEAASVFRPSSPPWVCAHRGSRVSRE